MNVRRPSPEDLPEVLALCHAADRAVWGDSDWTEVDLRDEWDELDLDRDAWLVELDGRIAGYGTYQKRFGRLMGAEEWGLQPQTWEEFSEQRLGAARFDPPLTPVAKVGGEIAAFSLNDWKHNGDWGWVGSLAVRPPWRRRGLGEALLCESFREFFRRGERTVALGVDAQNPTGATRLYERVGMRVLWEAVVYRKELP